LKKISVEVIIYRKWRDKIVWLWDDWLTFVWNDEIRK